MSPDRRARLLEQKARIEARLHMLDAREQARRRKDDTRRKIIAGALALEHAELDAAFGAALAKLLNRYVQRPQDRALFDLPEREQDNRPAPVSAAAPFAESA